MLPEMLTDNNPCLQAPSRPIEGELQFSTMSTTGPWSAGTTAQLICKLPYISQGETKSICINGMFSPLGECILPDGGTNNNPVNVMPQQENIPMIAK
uniref:Sushi domain-containing protein n=1 Tax=Panagrolaimus superbus TaxID=310955 RepID=A0A914YN04_9BILA